MGSYFPNHPHLLNPKPASESQKLFDLAKGVTPFSSDRGQAWVSLDLGENGEIVWPARSPRFRDWLIHRFQEEHGKLPAYSAVREVIRTFEANAHMGSGPAHTVSLRVSATGKTHGPRLLTPTSVAIDLANEQGQSIDISPDGWEVTHNSACTFRDSRNTRPLPNPTPAESSKLADLSPLRSLLPLSSNDDWLRVQAWLLSALHPTGPYPILILQGPPGSGKTTAATILRTLIDPSASPFSQRPRSEREALQTAYDNRVIAIDHVTRISTQLSDSLCRLSSGAGFSLPEPCSQREPLPLALARPIILTLNDDNPGAPPKRHRLLRHPALADRALIANLEPIPSGQRRTEEQLWTDFEKAHPGMLAGLSTAVSTALRRLPELRLQSLPRMAGAAAWVAAAAPALGVSEQQILDAFEPDDDPGPDRDPDPNESEPEVRELVRDIARLRQPWSGTATDLANELPADVRGPSAATLSWQLRKAVPALARDGIEVTFARVHGGRREITIRAATGDGPPPAPVTKPHQPPAKPTTYKKKQIRIAPRHPRPKRAAGAHRPQARAKPPSPVPVL